ncbi:hypothetical protein RJT34_13132 [Clitoria ternatea]|uniref:Uncharacterized protein n=1 Tax=Clitoria ternatea TaxID=43366 RepID=A0AAN9JND6_CLITE
MIVVIWKPFYYISYARVTILVEMVATDLWIGVALEPLALTHVNGTNLSILVYRKLIILASYVRDNFLDFLLIPFNYVTFQHKCGFVNIWVSTQERHS